MAVTHYYFNEMNHNTINYILIVIVTILSTKLVLDENSSPVEEMYHRQLVVTVDSILDARFSVEDGIKR